MSNFKGQKVWVGFIDYDYIDAYPFNASYPNLHDFKEDRLIIKKLIQEPNNEELKQQNQLNAIIGSEISSRLRNFVKLDVLPDSLWRTIVDEQGLPKDNEYAYLISDGGYVVNENCANVLQQFNLGETTLTPVKIHNCDTNELWSDVTYYFLNLCEHRHYVAEKQSHPRMKYKSKGFKKPFYRISHHEDDIVEVLHSAVNCDLDFWHDPLLRGSYFFSDRLYKTLVRANMHEKFNAHFCKLV